MTLLLGFSKPPPSATRPPLRTLKDLLFRAWAVKSLVRIRRIRRIESRTARAQKWSPGQVAPSPCAGDAESGAAPAQRLAAARRNRSAKSNRFGRPATKESTVAIASIALLLSAFTLSDPSAKVIDGDTLEVMGQRVRLWGMDAPELTQRCRSRWLLTYGCGEAAAAYLSVLLKRPRKLECFVESTDVYGRLVATCTVEGNDIGEAMVRAGWAVDFKRYSKGTYAAAEKDARDNRRGLWAGTFDRPEDHRRRGSR